MQTGGLLASHGRICACAHNTTQQLHHSLDEGRHRVQACRALVAVDLALDLAFRRDAEVALVLLKQLA